MLTTGNLISIANEVASAMEHLEAKNVKLYTVISKNIPHTEKIKTMPKLQVIHGDLAARNVLITEDLHAKVCDFGLSKQLLHYTVYVQKVEVSLWENYSFLLKMRKRFVIQLNIYIVDSSSSTMDGC